MKLDAIMLLYIQQHRNIAHVKKPNYGIMVEDTSYSDGRKKWLRISADTKAKTISLIKSGYSQRINEIYNEINAELQENGRTPLINPFIPKGENDNAN